MATASENARKVLNSIKAKLNLDKFPRGTFIEGVTNCKQNFSQNPPKFN